MQSEAADVDAYLDEVPADRRAALTALRDLCIDVLDGYEESMDYGMPSYRRPGEKIEVAFASQARHVSVYVMRTEVLDRFRGQLSTNHVGKGCIRYGSPEQLDFDVLGDLLSVSATATGPIC
ncbi:MAG TPA: DUF1801 domain-containing protein [Acidimicrobiales bacterium]|nr:DUF1801 domain-containing protein [Acidimicrobiales bacterium]